MAIPARVVAIDEQSGSPTYTERLHYKSEPRQADESTKPLARYNQEEMEEMKQNTHGFDPCHRVAHDNVLWKMGNSRTPSILAKQSRAMMIRRVS
jgi:hypothetical protein